MSQESPKKSPPAYLFALGKKGMPELVEVDGPLGRCTYRFVDLYKHDFFAATGLYEWISGIGDRESAAPSPIPDPRCPIPDRNAPNPDSRFPIPDGNAPIPDPTRLAVLKIQRTHHLFGFPMRWLGAHVARHEVAVIQALAGVRGVPEFLGLYGTTGFLHAFVPGEPLRDNMPFTRLFFEQLRQLLVDIHARDVAYVDTNKRENILMGDDGRPWLIDFQISYSARRAVKGNFISMMIFRRMKRADWYHYYKHKTRLIPSACTSEDFAAAEDRGLLHSLHRMIARPIIQVRRRFLSRYELDKTK
jgi:hypothetical protein